MDAVGGAERRLEVDSVTRGEKVAVIAAFVAVYVVWGSTYLGIAWAVESIPPFLMIGARCLLSGVVLYGWARWRGGARPSAADWRAALVVGILMFVTGQAVLAWAETRVPSGATSLLVATEPLFVALLAWRGGRLTGAGRTRPDAMTIGAILLGFIGVGIMVMPQVGGGLDPLGSFAALLAAFSWSVGMFRAGARPRVGPAQMAGMQLLMAGAVLVTLSAATGEAFTFPAGGPTLRSLLSLGYLVVMGSVVTYGAYVWLLGRVGTARVSTHAYVNPAVAVALGALLNGEAVTPTLLVSSAIIILSVVVLVRPRSRPGTSDPQRDDVEPGGARPLGWKAAS